MSDIKNQIIVGAVVALFSATVYGMKTMYDDVQSNTVGVIHIKEKFESIDEKLNKLIDSQLEMAKDITNLHTNQKLILNNKIKQED